MLVKLYICFLLFYFVGFSSCFKPIFQQIKSNSLHVERALHKYNKVASNDDLKVIKRETYLHVNPETLDMESNKYIVNYAVVSTLLLFAMYQIFHVDLEAITALYTYDVEVDRLSTSVDLLSRLPQDMLSSYEGAVIATPILAKASTSGVSYFVGDLAAQYVVDKDLGKADLVRSLKSSIAGFVGHGPFLHFWLLFLGGIHWGCPNYLLNFFSKIALDQGPASFFFNSLYISLVGLMNFKSIPEISEDLKSKVFKSMAQSIKFW